MAVCDRAGLDVGEQIAAVVERLRPVQPAVRGLVAHSNVVSVLQVVRYLDGTWGGDADSPSELAGFTKLEGQHHLLGWHLDFEILEFLVGLRVSLDVDEYG